MLHTTAAPEQPKYVQWGGAHLITDWFCAASGAVAARMLVAMGVNLMRSNGGFAASGKSRVAFYTFSVLSTPFSAILTHNSSSSGEACSNLFRVFAHLCGCHGTKRLGTKPEGLVPSAAASLCAPAAAAAACLLWPAARPVRFAVRARCPAFLRAPGVCWLVQCLLLGGSWCCASKALLQTGHDLN